MGLLSLDKANIERLFLFANQSIGGTLALPLGMPKPFTKYSCLCCALVYQSTVPFSLGLMCKILVDKILFGFKKALFFSSSVCNDFANTLASFTVKGCALIGFPFLSISKCSTYISIFIPLVRSE